MWGLEPVVWGSEQLIRGLEPLVWGLEVNFSNNGIRRSEMWGSWPPSPSTLVTGCPKYTVKKSTFNFLP